MTGEALIKRENKCCNGKQSIDSSQIHPITACAQTCRSPHPSMIEKGGINEQTRLAVVINVQMPVFLMGHLIRSLVVAAGSLSHPITAPPCQNLCCWPPHPTIPPHSRKHVPGVSYDICVSRSCDGMLPCLLCLRRCSLLATIHFEGTLLRLQRWGDLLFGGCVARLRGLEK